MTIDWVDFYKEFSSVLLIYKNDRSELLRKFKEIYAKIDLNYPFKEHGNEEYHDICPFTVFGTFNRGLTLENRIGIIKEIKKSFDIKASVPTGLDATPVVVNISAAFFANKEKRNVDDIDHLWTLFQAAIEQADHPSSDSEKDFVQAYDRVLTQNQIKWNITIGLFWIRPHAFLSLDSRNRSFLMGSDRPYRDIILNYSKLKRPPEGDAYINIIKDIREILNSDNVEPSNFLELSHAAFELSVQEIEENIYEISDESDQGINYWLISLGERSKYWNEFYKKGIVAIGWDELGPLSQYTSRSAIISQLKRLNDNRHLYTNDSLALWQFYAKMKPNDVVYVKRGIDKIIARGIVKSDYDFDETRDFFKHIRQMKWTHDKVIDYPENAPKKTLTNITQYIDVVKKLEEAFNIDKDEYILEETPYEYDAYTEEEFLKEVFISSEKYGSIISLLNTKKNIILQGPPGVGKTFSAKRLAYSILKEKDSSRVKMIQFHQSYSYEDFIMGYRPSESGFVLQPGPFYEFCNQAKEDIDRDYFFIIDEINRGNLSKIFGELLMLVESDKRNQYLKLMYKDELFTVPDNVYLIGLMNTADRSLAMIDYALRRRFAFVDIQPAFDSEGFKVRLDNEDNPKFHQLIRLIKLLNSDIAGDDNLGEGFLIGHSYFCIFNEVSDERIRGIIQHEIMPLLKEYWYDDKNKVSSWSDRLNGILND